MSDIVSEFESLGRVWIRGAIRPDSLEDFAKHCSAGSRPGLRLTLTPELAAHIDELSSLIEAFGVDPAPVRLVAFNKSPEANWSVPWHQDRVIAVAHKREVAGYFNWTPKDGFWHCEPPMEVLNRMIFVRVHFDACDKENGAMELALCSHRAGLVGAERARQIAETGDIEVCRAGAGDILIVNALMLHRSSAAETATARRTLRIDFAVRSLLAPQLEWAVASKKAVRFS